MRRYSKACCVAGAVAVAAAEVDLCEMMTLICRRRGLPTPEAWDFILDVDGSGGGGGRGGAYDDGGGGTRAASATMGGVVLPAAVGPGIFCSKLHRLPCDSRHEDSHCHG